MSGARGAEYWTGKVALVTGASSGLGWHIAAALAAAGASVVMAARDSTRLDAAVSALSGSAGRVLPVAADVTNQEHVERLLARAIDEFGRLDALVNCVGASSRGRAIDTAPEEFARLLDLNLIAAVRCTRAAVPHLLESRGHVVNIGSLSGKTASRYLGAYPASKFALTAYTQQLRLELGPEGLHVLLVLPGPIAREDAGVRYADRAGNLPDSARQPGGGVKLKGIDPGTLARRILRACERRQAELVVPGRARLLFAVQQLWPRLGDWILRRMT
jgi:NAD(P)-dependent dehydrogenase (short-subunit alcohol dehydrogenase family)